MTHPIDLAAAVEAALLRAAHNVAKHIVQRDGWDEKDECFQVDLRAAQTELMAYINRYRVMARHIGRLIPPDEDNFARACGECVCPKCGLSYFCHPICSDGILHVLCDGTQVKL